MTRTCPHHAWTYPEPLACPECLLSAFTEATAFGDDRTTAGWDAVKERALRTAFAIVNASPAMQGIIRRELATQTIYYALDTLRAWQQPSEERGP